MSGHRIDLDAIVARIHEQGVWASVEMTGGGCATIFAGARRTVPDNPGDPYCTCEHTEFAAVAGPGTYGWGQGPSFGHTTEFFISADDNGEGSAVDCSDLGIDPSEEDLAALIVAQTRLPSGDTLSHRQALDVILQNRKPLPADQALDVITEFMNRPGPWNGGDVCDVVAEALKATGRTLSLQEED